MTSFSKGSLMHRRMALAGCIIAIAVIWCVLLPWVSSRPVVRKRLDFLDQKGIDPSAMYYTELDAMDSILDRIEGRSSRRRD